MSTFQSWSSALIPLGDSIAQAQGVIVAALQAGNWRVLHQGVAPAAVGGTITNPNNALDMLPGTNAGQAGTGATTLAVQMPSAFTPTALYVQASHVMSSNSLETDTPTSITIEYSDTSLTTGFTTLQTFTPANWGLDERRKFTIAGAGAHVYWRSTFSGATTNTYVGDWAIEDASGNYCSNQQFADVIPPVVELIGNASARDVVRLLFNATTIQILPVQELLISLPTVFSFAGATGGAVTLQVSNGTNVQFVGSGGNTSQQNARGLYLALCASVDANFTAFNWVWVQNLQGENGSPQIWAIQKTPAPTPMMTSSNITIRLAMQYASPAGTQGCGYQVAQSLTSDLTNGFVYYLGVNSRGFSMATKTNVGYYGPAFACYGDNASALAQLPTADFAAYGLPCTPIELFVGSFPTQASCDGTARTSHWWGTANTAQNPPNAPYYVGTTESGYSQPHMWGKGWLGGMLQDLSGGGQVSTYTAAGSAISCYAEGFMDGADTGAAYSIHKLGVGYGANYNYVSSNFGSPSGRTFSPPYQALDAYKYYGVGPASEQLIVAPSNDFTATITSLVAVGDTTINVNSTTGFPVAGWLVMDGEIIQYTGGGGGGTQFTGCTRGKYATAPASMPVGTTVFIGGWFCIFNYGLIFGGYQTPT